MELTHDWRGFQVLFYPQRRASAFRANASSGPVYLVVDGDSVVSAFADHEDLSDWVGASYQDMRREHKHRDLIAFDREQVDQWQDQALSKRSFYDQVEFLRSTVKPRAEEGKSQELQFRRHFLVDALLGWWSKMLPSAYGVFIRVEGQPEQNFILLYRNKTFEAFHEPDLSTLAPDRRRSPEAVTKYLSERYLVPVQSIFVSGQEWNEWCSAEDPWKAVGKGVRTGRARLFPFRWSLASLIMARAYTGV